MELPEDIRKYVKNEFASEQIAEAFSLLENAVMHDGSAAEPRLLRCALVASKNNIERLRYQVDGLAYDFRDVILDAEYVRKKGVWVQIRDLSKPFE